MIPLVERARDRRGHAAVIDAAGRHAYDELLVASRAGARRLLAGHADLGEGRVAFLAPPCFEWVAAQWAIWRAGGVAVPLAVVHPEPELEAAIADSEAEALVAHPSTAGRLRPIAERRGLELHVTDELLATTGSGPDRRRARRPAATTGKGSGGDARGEGEARGGGEARAGGGARGGEDASGPDRAGVDTPGALAGGRPALPEVDPGRRAMIVYTSGTTGRPKGVVTTHANIAAQVESLVEAWEWSPEDRILLVLPLHHVHGIVNVVCCALWSGATCEMLPSFDAEETWRRIAEHPISLFMAVPTIYTRLIRAWEAAPRERRRELSAAAARLRLMVSGSAALPVSVLERWKEISGHVLLERYGMTEIGMALSNPLHGRRVPGSVGTPLPGVEVRLVDEGGRPVPAGESGQVEVRGPGVFAEYWRRPGATREVFRDDGWFRTGDVAVVEDGRWRLLGRQSVDIIKTGGYKVSALEIEEVLRRHPAVGECAVVGVPDEEWGERVAVAVEVAAGRAGPELEELREWARERLAVYKLPSRLRVVDELPRNALGKVTKPAVAELFEGGSG